MQPTLPGHYKNMDNQNQPKPPVVQPQEPQMATAAPMPEPASAPPPSSSGKNKMLWLVLALVVLLLAGGAYYYFVISKSSTDLSAYPASAVIPTGEEPLETPAPTVTPIGNSSDLDGALNQIDSADTSATSELNANTQDSTTFSQ